MSKGATSTGHERRAPTPLNVPSAGLRFQTLIGTGGIGSGVFFALNGNHTLGREESRSGRFLRRRDYCKLHIIAHYVQVLLGPNFTTFPIGKVGDDEPGSRLLTEMTATGMDLSYVQTVSDEQTLYAICLVYPDGSGCNLTVDDSACARVGAEDVAAAEPLFARFEGRGIALAVPEVPLTARAAVCERGTRFGFHRVASFTSGEMAWVRKSNILAQVDLLAINRDEAAALAGVSASGSAERVASSAINIIARDHPNMAVVITAGKSGSWLWDGTSFASQPAYTVPVANTAGAGDALLAGLLAGLAARLPLSDAHELGSVVAALSVTSPHTIHRGVDRDTLGSLARKLHLNLSPSVAELLRR